MTIKKLESYSLIFVTIALIINFITVLPFGNTLVAFGLTTPATIYLICSMVAYDANGNPMNNPPDKKTFRFENFVNITFSVFMIGTLFTIQYWPNASFFMDVAMAGLVISLAVIIFKRSNGKPYSAALAKRMAVYLCLAVVLAVLPRFTLLDIKYRSQPAYLNALKNSIQHPGDTALQHKVNQEREKINK